MDISKCGEYLITCDGEQIILYNLHSGEQQKKLYHKESQLDLVRFTHNSDAIICATQKDHSIIYWSLHDNEIVKKFTGHTDVILCLDLNNSTDKFLSTSQDCTLRFWDLNSMIPGADAILDLSQKKCNPVAAFDNLGLVYAISYTESLGGADFTKIALYDVKKHEEGSFAFWNYDCAEIRTIKFSQCGNLILCSTVDNIIIVIDSFEGTLKQKINTGGEDIMDPCFTPCSQFLITGGEKGIIHVWKTQTGEEVTKLSGHFLKPQICKFSPSHCLLISACKNLIFWLPDIKQ
ncbi:WD domain protein [Ichthyophthirius multifiliis]|uniref:WD domain protein n=1 Tax=Ichthyophthirius multifiliis TaxID=5932 RepID=G0QNL9_ICHMU|nr:WD domain protein [Ichthyophthirius multifiliis]EGR33180.1 WD domain protein [Ichthyophthirius multifiliis]|eukprot:XP_004037166.1 WD domain protein [Ichthyophthirius multifiliis]